ncbi:MAG: HD domain-containing protein [Candidatus Diapherotrites archaeon]|nr:HD domain-containing protein [Candidatus Diapherotrites archaeon]
MGDWDEWKRRYTQVKRSYECAAVAYAAFQDNRRFIHTVRTAYWVKRTSKRTEAVIAAWLHDVGHAEDPERHAEIGAAWAKRWLEGMGLDKESINLVVDGILNHGTKGKPKTDVGHAVRLANALATVDPVVMAAVPEEELQGFKKHVEKKRVVIREYQEKRQ